MTVFSPVTPITGQKCTPDSFLTTALPYSIIWTRSNSADSEYFVNVDFYRTDGEQFQQKITLLGGKSAFVCFGESACVYFGVIDYDFFLLKGASGYAILLFDGLTLLE